jgi:hypothetical protein
MSMRVLAIWSAETTDLAGIFFLMFKSYLHFSEKECYAQ